jgi:hypothetical protein
MKLAYNLCSKREQILGGGGSKRGVQFPMFAYEAAPKSGSSTGEVHYDKTAPQKGLFRGVQIIRVRVLPLLGVVYGT